MHSTRGASEEKRGHCEYCGGRLDLGFYFTCHICEKTYCYAHMTRHSRAHPRPGLQLQELKA